LIIKDLAETRQLDLLALRVLVVALKDMVAGQAERALLKSYALAGPRFVANVLLSRKSYGRLKETCDAKDCKGQHGEQLLEEVEEGEGDLSIEGDETRKGDTIRLKERDVFERKSPGRVAKLPGLELDDLDAVENLAGVPQAQVLHAQLVGLFLFAVFGSVEGHEDDHNDGDDRGWVQNSAEQD